MPKIKTRKSAAKRFKISGTGKIIRRSSDNSHMMLAKSPSRKRRLDIPSVVTGGHRKVVSRMIPNAF